MQRVWVQLLQSQTWRLNQVSRGPRVWLPASTSPKFAKSRVSSEVGIPVQKSGWLWVRWSTCCPVWSPPIFMAILEKIDMIHPWGVPQSQQSQCRSGSSQLSPLATHLSSVCYVAYNAVCKLALISFQPSFTSTKCNSQKDWHFSFFLGGMVVRYVRWWYVLPYFRVSDWPGIWGPCTSIGSFP